MLAPAEGQLGHPDRQQDEFERLDQHPGGGGPHDVGVVEQVRQPPLDLCQRLTARLERGICHGHVVHFREPAGEIARVIRLDERQVKGGDHLQKNSGQFAGGGKRQVVDEHGILVVDAHHFPFALVAERRLRLILDHFRRVIHLAADVEGPQGQVQPARQVDLLFGFDVVALHPVDQQTRGLTLVEGVRQDRVRREQVFGVFQIDHMRRIAVGAVGRDLFGRQDELRAAAVAMEGLLLQRLAVPLQGRHRDDEILFVLVLCAQPQRVLARAVIADQRRAVGRECHASAALGAHEPVRIGAAQTVRRGGQVVRVDDVTGFEFAVEDGKGAPRAGVVQVVREAVLQRLALFGGVVGHFAHPEPCFGKHLMRACHVNGAVEVALRPGLVAGLRFDDSAA